jgi:hypothetical protein
MQKRPSDADLRARQSQRAIREFMKIKVAASQHSGPGEEDRAA